MKLPNLYWQEYLKKALKRLCLDSETSPQVKKMEGCLLGVIFMQGGIDQSLEDTQKQMLDTRIFLAFSIWTPDSSGILRGVHRHCILKRKQNKTIPKHRDSTKLNIVMYRLSQSLCFTGVNCHYSTGCKLCNIFQTYLTTEHSFCGTLTIFSNTCSGNSLGDIIVSYLFLNFPFGKDIENICSYSTSPGSHSSSFSNDQNLMPNWFQTSERTNPIISPRHCRNHTQLGLISPSSATARSGQVPRAFQAHATPR